MLIVVKRDTSHSQFSYTLRNIPQVNSYFSVLIVVKRDTFKHQGKALIRHQYNVTKSPNINMTFLKRQNNVSLLLGGDITLLHPVWPFNDIVNSKLISESVG